MQSLFRCIESLQVVTTPHGLLWAKKAHRLSFKEAYVPGLACSRPCVRFGGVADVQVHSNFKPSSEHSYLQSSPVLFTGTRKSISSGLLNTLVILYNLAKLNK